MLEALAAEYQKAFAAGSSGIANAASALEVLAGSISLDAVRFLRQMLLHLCNLHNYLATQVLANGGAGQRGSQPRNVGAGAAALQALAPALAAAGRGAAEGGTGGRASIRSDTGDEAELLKARLPAKTCEAT